MRKTFLYIGLLLFAFSITCIQGNSSKSSKSKYSVPVQSSPEVPLCGVKSDVRYYFLEEGLYEFSVSDASTGMAKYSICVEGTEASGRCREDNFNVPWKFYVDKGLPITIWRSMRRKVTDENGKTHYVYGAPEETTILKDPGNKNWKDWKGSVLRWQEADSTGKVFFKMNVKVKKIK